MKNLSLAYGPKTQLAFRMLAQNKSREEIQSHCGTIFGVTQIDLKVYRGETLILMGLSGSGKSSLLRCMNGINGRQVGTVSGDVHFFLPNQTEPIDIQNCSDQKLRDVRRNHLSMVFQQFALIPWRTVSQNVSYPLEIQGLSPSEISKRVHEKLALVHLEKWSNAYPSELSGGMQQRVGIARALATDANVLLMDEPFSALDPLHRRSLQTELLQLQAELKKTIVFVTHDFDEAIRLGSRIAIIEAGRLLQVGTSDQIMTRPACEQVQKFTAYVS